MAAIRGACIGIGVQQALCCDVRFAAEDMKMGVAFAKFGLVAEAGISWNMTRLAGAGAAMLVLELVPSGVAATLQAALPILSEGRRLKPAEALSAGLIHATVSDAGQLLPAARAWIAANPSPRQPWDDPKWRIPGGTPSNPAIAAMLPIAPAMLQQKTTSQHLRIRKKPKLKRARNRKS